MSSSAPMDIIRLMDWIEEVNTMAAKSLSYPCGIQTEEATRARSVPEEFKLTCWRCGRLALADPDLSNLADEGIRNAADQFFHVVTGDRRVRSFVSRLMACLG
nr:hypothetical protein B14D6.170 [imported] - Neurospora crassa [Neurospora crassa]